MADWLSALSNGVDAVINWFQGNDELEYQKQQNAVQNKMSWTNLLTDSTTNINTLLTAIESAVTSLDTYQSTIDTGNEWLQNYQAMLNGDRSDTTLGRKLGQLERQGTLLEMARTLKEKSAANYLVESAVSRANAYDTAFSDYTSMLKNQSLLNVAAGANGGKSSAYSMASAIQQQQLRSYIGADMQFDTDTAKGVSAESGSFLNSYIVLTNTIDAQIEENNYAIKAAQDSVLNNTNLIKDFYEESETTASQWKADIEDSEKATETMETAIERIKNALKLQQTTALDALENLREQYGIKEISAAEYTKQLGNTKDGVSFTTGEGWKGISDTNSQEWIDQSTKDLRSYLQMKEAYEASSKSIEIMKKKEEQRKKDKES